MSVGQVQSGQKPKATARRSLLLTQAVRADGRLPGSPKSEESLSGAATDSEADSITTDGGSRKSKPGKKGARA